MRPVYVAIAERKGQRRVIAVDGHTGRLLIGMGRVLTGQLTLLNQAARL